MLMTAASVAAVPLMFLSLPCCCVLCVTAMQVDVLRFMSDADRLDELIQAVKLQHQQEMLQEMLGGGS